MEITLKITIGSILEPFKLTEEKLNEAVDMHCIYTKLNGPKDDFKKHLSTILNDEGKSAEYILKYIQSDRSDVDLYGNDGFIDPDFLIAFISRLIQ